MITQEIKGTLAKLLASENLVVEHRVCETASFDVDRRVLVLPIWKDLDNDTYDLLVGHEVGHALYTPTTEQEAIPSDIPRSYVNVTEDARIERRMKAKFPGLTKSFYRGYQHLHERDFFNVQNNDLSRLKLIDRINLHFKIGTYALIPFADGEQQYVDLVEEAETFSDCIDAARVIYDYEKQKRKEEQESKAPQEQDAPQTVDTVTSDDGPGETEDADADNTSEDLEEQKGGDPWDDEAQLDVPSFEQDNIEEAETDTALQENLENSASKDTWDNPTYVEIDDPNLDVAIVDHKDVTRIISTFWNEQNETRKENGADEINFGPCDKAYRKFVESSNREVNYLVKEFECRKSAASYARQSVSRTGVLDCTKLHTYKYNEDLFKKVTSTPDGKNHGLIFLLDWSGSMCGIIQDTIKQLLSLTSFCRKVGIPFEVYSFVNDPMWGGLLDNASVELTSRRNHTYAFHHTFRLVNLLSSRERSSEYETSARNLFRIGRQFESRRFSWEDRSNHIDITIPSCMGLGGTTLNDAIASIPALEKRFQTYSAVEKLNVVILSDGESNNAGEWITRVNTAYGEYNQTFYSALGYKHCLRRRGRTYPALDDYSRQTRGLISYVRDVCPNVNVVGFRIAAPREAHKVICHWTEWNSSKYEPIQASFKKNKAAVIPDCGYNELYVIAATALDNDVEFEVQEDATKSQIKSAFKKTLKGKAANKKVLTSFIKQIA